MKRQWVSVILSYTDTSRYVLEAVRSVEAQTYDSVELVIVDTTKEKPAADKLIKDVNVPALKIIRGGAALASEADILNFAHALSVGSYFLPLNADDLIEPEFINLALKEIQNNSSVGCVYSQMQVLDGSASLSLFDCDLSHVLCDLFVPRTYLFSREAFEACGKYSGERRIHHRLWINALTQGWRLKRLELPLYCMRTQEINIPSLPSVKEFMQAVDEHKQFYSEHLDEVIHYQDERFWRLKDQHKALELQSEFVARDREKLEAAIEQLSLAQPNAYESALGSAKQMAGKLANLIRRF